MTIAEQKQYVELNYSQELDVVHNLLEIEEYRDVEDVIDKVGNEVFTRYCVTLLIDQLISFETEKFAEED